MLKKYLPAFALAISSICLAVQAHEIWTDNYADAKARADKEGKDLLLEFTGSDWCPFCIKLRKEVFEQSDFKKSAPNDFVLVELDFPHQKKQSAATVAQNESLQEEYGIEGFPTVLLTDTTGMPYAKLGYTPNAAAMTQHIADLHRRRVARTDLLARAKIATGVERAKLLDQAIAGKDHDEIIVGLDGIIDQIVEADSENKAGLKGKYETRVEMRPILKIAQDGDVNGAVAKLDTILQDKEASAIRKQEILYIKAILLQFKSDEAGSLATLKAAKDLDPTSDRGHEIAGILEEIQQSN